MTVIVGVSGQSLNQSDIDILSDPLVSGVILFPRNYANLDQLKALTQSIRELRSDLLLCTDHEGGRVQRLKAHFTELPPMGDLNKIWQSNPSEGEQLAFACGYITGHELQQSGIDSGLSPVLDIDRHLNNVVGNRSFGNDSQTVAELASAYCRGARASGAFTVGKHFPGHGGSAQDSHTDAAYDSRTMAELENDLFPFKTLIQRQLLDAIMPAHVIYSEVDSKPAGFSKVWLTDILKNQCGFKGLIISDCLTMQAAQIDGGIAEAAAQALEAGCSSVIICHHLEKIPQILADLNKRLPANYQPSLKPQVEVVSDAEEYLRQINILKNLEGLVADLRTSEIQL